MLESKKISIVADWLVAYAGAERVIAEFINVFPNADLFSVVDFISNENRKYFHGKKHQRHLFKIFPKQRISIRNIFH
jgi:hypothetical protein